MKTNNSKQTMRSHLQELKRRLMLVSLSLVVGGVTGLIFQDTLIDILVRPIHHQKLIYTSPTGGFEFIFKVCLFVGILASIPVAIYQIIRFLEPALKRQSFRFIALLLMASCFLLVAGVAFAYFISLPAALNFLMKIGNDNIQALLSTNEYMNFVMIYLAAFGLLFQIPLLLLFINRITPLKPSGLIRSQRFVILGSFVAGAIITPTPDPFNQALMSVPIIVMFQIGVGLVWLANRHRAEPERQLYSEIPLTTQDAAAPHRNPPLKASPSVTTLDLSQAHLSSPMTVSPHKLDLRQP